MKAFVLKCSPNVHFDLPELFWVEGVRLSQADMDIFLNDLRQGLFAVFDSSTGIGN